jgi:precorrin-6B C5,15-methyltransferase / cobalt-precorrin-6B C5,C15-methyltransferase
MVKGLPVTSTRPLGLHDDAFEQRRPLRGQITKREVRAVSLYSLGLRHDSIVWDIGAGTGSVSVEAALIAAQGEVYAVERDESSIELLRRNVGRFGSANVHVVAGEAPVALSDLPDPDSVFIGGSGGQLVNILDTVARRLKPAGRIVANLAALERAQEAYHRLKERGLSTEIVMVNAAQGKELKDGTVRLESLNPVFIVIAQSKGQLDE